ncbi:MAG: NADPH:quinone oxidoreductase family protein [Polyangiales bacterium]|nr:NADPH:quinone oxidoreductase family protein [Myxococcales bacterium]
MGRRAVVSALASNPEAALDALVLEDQPTPQPGPGDVVVAVRAANVGWVDLLMTSGQYQHVPEPPYTPGLEWAGEVVAVGEGVTTFAPGDRVIADGLLTGPRSLGNHRRWGGFASWAVAPESALVRLPDALSFEQGACLLGGHETAYHALVNRARLRAGESVLILGATGSTGLAAVQIAHHLGTKVIAAGRTPSKLEVVKEHGADCLLRTVDDEGNPRRFKEDVKALTGGRGVDVVYDVLGGELSTEALRACAFGARFVVVGWSATPFVARGGRDPNVLPTNLILMKSIDVLGSPAAIAVHRDPSLRQERLDAVLALATSLPPRVDATYPLDQLTDALRAKWKSTHVGNVVVTP